MKQIKAKSVVALFLSGAVMVGGLGLVVARESGPSYQAPDLMLTQGQAVYDLCDGIQFDGSKYDLSVYDQGAFDINAPGSYTVEYLLTPVEQPSTSGPVDTVSPTPGETPTPTGETSTPLPEVSTTPEETMVPSPTPEVTTGPIPGAPTASGEPSSDMAETEIQEAPVPRSALPEENGTGSVPEPDAPAEGAAQHETQPPDTAPNDPPGSSEQPDMPAPAPGDESLPASSTPPVSSEQPDTPTPTPGTESTPAPSTPPASSEQPETPAPVPGDGSTPAPSTLPAGSEQPETSTPAPEVEGNPAPGTEALPAQEPIHFTRMVIVTDAVRYQNIRFDIDTAADLFSGMVYDGAHYALTVLDDGGFNSGRIDEYKVSYRLTNTDNGLTITDLERYVWVTAPGVEFDAPELSLVLNQKGYDLREGIGYDAANYTLTATNADVVDTAIEGEQRVLFTLTALPSVSMLADSTVPMAMEEATPADTTVPETEVVPVAAIFGRDVTVKDGPAVVIDAPPLIIVEGTAGSHNLLEGVMAKDESGNVVKPQVEDRSALDRDGGSTEKAASPAGGLFSLFSGQSTESTRLPADLTAGQYTVTLSATHPVTGAVFTAERSIVVLAVGEERTLTDGCYQIDVSLEQSPLKVTGKSVTVRLFGTGSIGPGSQSGNAIDVAAGSTLTLILESGSNVTLTGRDAANCDSAGAAIHIPAASVLHLKGTGRLEANGGNGASGDEAAPGGGAGAGIGGNGGIGGASGGDAGTVYLYTDKGQVAAYGGYGGPGDGYGGYPAAGIGGGGAGASGTSGAFDGIVLMKNGGRVCGADAVYGAPEQGQTFRAQPQANGPIDPFQGMGAGMGLDGGANAGVTTDPDLDLVTGEVLTNSYNISATPWPVDELTAAQPDGAGLELKWRQPEGYTPPPGYAVEGFELLSYSSPDPSAGTAPDSVTALPLTPPDEDGWNSCQAPADTQPLSAQQMGVRMVLSAEASPATRIVGVPSLVSTNAAKQVRLDRPNGSSTVYSSLKDTFNAIKAEHQSGGLAGTAAAPATYTVTLLSDNDWTSEGGVLEQLTGMNRYATVVITGKDEKSPSSPVRTLTIQQGSPLLLPRGSVKEPGAAFEIRDITLMNGTANAPSYICANFSKLTMGTGITTVRDKLCLVAGGYDLSASVQAAGNSLVEIQSGSYEKIICGNFQQWLTGDKLQNSTVGNTQVTITGTTKAKLVLGGSYIEASFAIQISQSGSRTVTIDGDAVVDELYLGSRYDTSISKAYIGFDTISAGAKVVLAGGHTHSVAGDWDKYSYTFLRKRRSAAPVSRAES